MLDLTTLGKWLFFAGLGLAALGGGLWLLGRLGLPLGQLPGDIRLEGPGYSVYFPIVTMIIVSVVLTVIVNLVGRWFK